MKKSPWIIAAIMLCAAAYGAVSTNTDVVQTETENGYQIATWDFEADGTGAADVRTSSGYAWTACGVVHSAYYLPNTDSQIQGGTTFNITVTPIATDGTDWFAGSATTIQATATTDGLTAIPFYPTNTVVTGPDIQIGVTSATTGTGAGASGRIVMYISPSH